MLVLILLGCIIAIGLGMSVLTLHDACTRPSRPRGDRMSALSRIAVLLDGYIHSEWLQHRNQSGMAPRGWPVLARGFLPCAAALLWGRRVIAVPVCAAAPAQLQVGCSPRHGDLPDPCTPR